MNFEQKHLDGTRVTDSCTTVTDTCIDDNAGCNGTVCDCLPDFAWNGSICSKVFFSFTVKYYYAV